MQEVTAVVENGQIRLPPGVHLPDGLEVRVQWEGENDHQVGPYDREALTEEDVKAELRWATGKRFQQ